MTTDKVFPDFDPARHTASFFDALDERNEYEKRAKREPWVWTRLTSEAVSNLSLLKSLRAVLPRPGERLFITESDTGTWLLACSHGNMRQLLRHACSERSKNLRRKKYNYNLAAVPDDKAEHPRQMEVTLIERRLT